MDRKRVGLELHASVAAGHVILIVVAVFQARHIRHENAARQLVHRVRAEVPVVEVAHHADGFGVRSPDENTVHTGLRHIMAAEYTVRLLRLSGVEQVHFFRIHVSRNVSHSCRSLSEIPP